ASQGMLWISHSDLALSRLVVLYGCAMSLLLSSAVRMFFPPVTQQLLGVNAPALWLKHEAGSRGGRENGCFQGKFPTNLSVAKLSAMLWLRPGDALASTST